MEKDRKKTGSLQSSYRWFISYAFVSFSWKACLIAIFMTMLSYFFSNFEYPIFVETKFLQIASLINHSIKGGVEATESPDSIIFVDVSYDRELITIKENGLVKGEIDVTNRSKLEQLLKLLKCSDYKAVVLDIDFSSKYETGRETAIADLASQMDSIYIAKSDDITNAKILNKTYWVDHYVNALDNSFTKVALTRNDTLSLPMKMYLDKSHKRITNICGLVYFVDGTLSRRCVYPNMYIGSNVITYGLGELLNANNDPLGYTPNDVKTLVKDKIVIVGSVEGDLDNYNTYCGKYPGAIINANIYLSLWNGAYKYPSWLIIIQFVLFYICGIHILTDHKDNKFENKSVTGIIGVSSFVWLYYTFILAIVCLFVYVVFDEAYDIIYSSTVLSIIRGFVELSKNIRHE